MSFRTLRQKSAWSCETNMSWDIGQAIRHMMRGGEKSRSSCAHPRGFLRSTYTRRPATTPLATRQSSVSLPWYLTLFVFALLLVCVAGFAQIPTTPSAPPPPGASSGQDSKIRVDRARPRVLRTVLDDRGRFADGLKQ